MRLINLTVLVFTCVLCMLSGATIEIRGFGKVDMAPLASTGLHGYTFQCENAQRAELFLHKLGRDMAQSSTVVTEWEEIMLDERKIPVLVRPGLGSFLLAAAGAKVLVFTTTQDRDLEIAYASAAPLLAGARFYAAKYRYPVYLDKFSHYGIGSWYPQYWGDNNTKGKPNNVDDHFVYAKKMGLTIQPNGGGYLLENLLPKIREYERPYHFAQWQEWTQELARMAPEELVMPGKNWSAMPHYYGQVSDGGKRLLTYRNWSFQQVVKRYVDDPLLVDWLDPNGEVGPHNFFYYWDFSEGNRMRFTEYLRTARGYTLASLGEAWYGNKGKFRSWDQVPIPMDYDLYGWERDSIQADRTWKMHPATLSEGLAKGYASEQCADGGWVSFPIPGNEMPAIFWRAAKPTWYRGTLNVPQAWLKAHKTRGRIYLNALAFTSTGGWRNPDRLWMNGQEMTALSHCPGYTLAGQVDVTDVLHAGRNTIAFLPNNPWWGIAGPFFLTMKPWEEYPFKNSHLNARYYDWHTYVSWCIAEKMEATYKAIRSVDPNRYIKMHAANDKYLSIPLQAKYGGFGHNTGEGGFFRPWDRRFGYVRGVPASAEFGGGIETVRELRRWIGWFTFEGLNAFDNFHNIQQMMYTPTADTWETYMPYLKLANRRDIKKPDIALLWSSLNCHILSRPVPYCNDLGRGDLQSIGYSYVDVDESTIRDGLVKDYPVLWDTSTWLMSLETVQQIKAYVEAGGTFVALQETGRHTFTRYDAWPISDLTGFKVREVRPMTGTLSILHDQPLFKKLAGKSFYNRGKSIDYSDYNYADKCIVLEQAAPGTQVIARYADGGIAIGMRTLGKGRVVVLGSPFWRDSYDGAGMWWPGESQCVFLEDMLAGLGLKPLASSNSHEVWREHYLANNGTEEYLALFNPFDEPKTLTVDWTTVHPAGGLYDPKNGQPIEGTINGNTVHLDKVILPAMETLIVATQPARPPQEAVKDWFDHLALWWRSSAPGQPLTRPALPVYDIKLNDSLLGKMVNGDEYAKMNLIALSNGVDPGEGWSRATGRSPETLRWKSDPTRRGLFRCSFTLPASWSAKDDCTLSVRAFSYMPGAAGPVDAYLNGVKVLDKVHSGASGYDKLAGGASGQVSAQLQFPGANTLVIVTGQFGFAGDVILSRKPAPSEQLEITGHWAVQQDTDTGITQTTLPGSFKGLFAEKRDITIPAAWKDSRVFIDISLGEKADYNAFAINGKMVLHPVNWFPAVTYMDITPWVKFGEANTLSLITLSATRGWAAGTLPIKRIVLQRVPMGAVR
ncbi:MAG: hypothetical protein ACYC7E_02470 [Armatimonadota bacterium]